MKVPGKVVVTGGADFIGSHTVVSLVEAGFEPIIIDNFSNSERSGLEGLKAIPDRDIACYAIDCTDSAAMQEVFDQERSSGVIHVAACKAVGESVKEPLKLLR